VSLTIEGEAQARRLGSLLRNRSFALVLTSPLARAADTARIAGFDDAVPEPDLVEWDYGDLEGLTTPQIRETDAGWTVWRGPVPNGETIDEVAARADRVIERVRAADGDSLVFAHGHFLRVFAARWLGLPGTAGAHFALSTATTSLLGWERGQPVIERWNEACAHPST
jgi:probable phosphoglycerate mutase